MIKKLFILTFFFLNVYSITAQDAKSEDVQTVLDSIWEMDQGIRFELIRMQQNGNMNSKEFKDLVEKMKKQDSLNLDKVKSILVHDWPDSLSMQANQTIFLVIQHADLNTQKTYLPAIEKAVKNNKTLPSNLALLKDRIALREGEKQIYGSQVFIDAKTGSKYVQPIKNPEKVDSLRSKVGLPSMENYLNQAFQMDWSLEKYYNDLKTLEKLIEEKANK